MSSSCWTARLCALVCCGLKAHTRARKGFLLCAALAVVHYKLGELEQSQDLYARAYDIQVAPTSAPACA